MVNLYNKYILPRITNKLCSSSPNMKQREKIVPLAYGDVLEIGVGTGLNIKYYDTKKVKHLYALEPSDEMWAIAKNQIELTQLNVNFIKGFSEQIPLKDNMIDSILITYTMCTITNLKATFNEMRRVLKPNGTLLFCEHGAAPDKSVLKWQNRINPIWKRMGGGCNLNRNIPELIKKGGFNITKLETMYIPGIKIASYNYWGIALPN